MKSRQRKLKTDIWQDNKTRHVFFNEDGIVTGPQALMDAWNAVTTPPIPRCIALSRKRRGHARNRLKEAPLEEWLDVFRHIETSPFCRGENDRGWVATFDWVMEQPDVRLKVLEGKYRARRHGGTRRLDSNAWTKAACPHGGTCNGPLECNTKILEERQRHA